MATIFTRLRNINPAVVSGSVMVLIGITLFATQSWLVGFPKGHHGWISSHTLANAVHTTSDTYLSGYSIEHLPSESQATYEYFNRMPFPGLMIMGLPSHAFSRLESQVMVSRHFNNVLVFLCILMAFRVLTNAGFSSFATLAACLCGLSGHYILFYRDQISVDLYSLFGLFLTVFAIQNYEMRGRLLSLYGCVIVAVSLGWGYSAIPTLGLWWAFRNVPDLVRRRSLDSLRDVVRHPSTICLTLGIGLNALFLVHNVVAESMVTGRPLVETSIVDSAMRRLGWIDNVSEVTVDNGAAFREDKVSSIGWFDYIRQQIQRIVMGCYPGFLHWRVESVLGKFHGEQLRGAVGPLGAWALALVVLGGVWLSIRKCRPEHRLAVALLAFGGAAWLLPMKNLGWFHDYTAVIYLGLTIVSFCGAFAALPTRVTTALILPLAAAWFLKANLEYKFTKDAWAAEVNPLTEDFQAIRDKLPLGAPVFYPDGYRHVTDRTPRYVVGFYLPQNPVGTRDNARYVVVDQPSWNTAMPLTPDNTEVFLLEFPESGR